MTLAARILAHLTAVLGAVIHGQAVIADDDMLCDQLAAYGAQQDDPDIAWGALFDALA